MARKSGGGYDREKMRKELEDRKKAGDQRKSTVNFKTFLVCPDNVSIYKPDTAGNDHCLDILPYQAGKFDPLCKEGEWAHCLDVFVHMNVGPSNDQFVCPNQYGKKCPICDDRKVLYEEGDEKRANRLWPSRRNVYNILCYDDKDEEDKGVQIFPVAYKYLEEPVQKLAAKSKRKDESDIDPNVLIADPVDGRTISFNVDSKKINIDGKSIFVPEYSSFELEKRKYEISEDELKDCYVLDEFLYLGEENRGQDEIDWDAFYKEIYESYYDEDFDGDKKEDDEKPHSRVRGGRSRDDKETDNSDNEDGKSSRSRRHSTRENKNDEDDDKKESQTKEDCPGEFGVDVRTFAECEDCDDFADCAVEKKNSESSDDDKKEEDDDDSGKSRGRSRGRSREKEEKKESTKRSGRSGGRRKIE